MNFMATEGSLPSTRNPPLVPILGQTVLAHVLLSSKSIGKVNVRTGHEGRSAVQI